MNIYFLTSLPIKGMMGKLRPCMEGAMIVDQLVAQYYNNTKGKEGGLIYIASIHDLAMQTLMYMVVRIYGSLGTHRIIDGHMLVMEKVVHEHHFPAMVLSSTRGDIYIANMFLHPWGGIVHLCLPLLLILRVGGTTRMAH